MYHEIECMLSSHVLVVSHCNYWSLSPSGASTGISQMMKREKSLSQFDIRKVKRSRTLINLEVARGRLTVLSLHAKGPTLGLSSALSGVFGPVLVGLLLKHEAPRGR
jgi:hypothetical protein